MRALLAAAALVCAMLVVSVAMGATLGWRVIGKASASGDFAVAAANGSTKHPHAIGVRITGGGTVSGFGVVACGVASIGSTSTQYHGHFALLKLPMRNADNCQVTASASGTGHLKLEIVAK